MTDCADETAYLVVVAMNRPRLNKILSLVNEKRTTHLEDQTSRHETSSIAKTSATLIPCLASMGAYEDENKKMIRYLSNVVYHDGTSMTKYFDDESFREGLRKVLLIGYEWHDDDTEKIGAYFKANQLEVEIECVTPNPEFESLHEEMEAYKNLAEERKEECLSDGLMGPGKMAKWVLEAVKRIENEQSEVVEEQEEETESIPDAVELLQQPVETVDDRIPPEEEHEPADPERPRYACRICRTILFGENHLAPDHRQNLHSFKKKSKSTMAVACQSLFCSESVLAWLSSPSEHDDDGMEGRLACPKCHTKIGHWRWAGAQCSCGTWVTPAIQIPLSKVDILPPESKIQSIPLLGVVNPMFVVPPRLS